MYMKNLEQELKENAYPGRGIVIGESKDGKTAVTVFLWKKERAYVPRRFILQN